MALTFLIALPLLAALFMLLLRPKDVRLIEGSAVVSSLGSLLLLFRIATDASENTLRALGGYLSFDALSAWITLIIVLVALPTALFSIGYLRAEVEKQIIGLRRVKQFFILFELFLFSMLLAVSAAHPILMWIAIEATTLATVFLISFYHKPSATEAAWKYLIVNSLGLLLGLLGTLLFVSLSSVEEGAFLTWEALRGQASEFHPIAVKVAFIFVLVGYGTKVGLVPMHTWLPDAHGKAPSPISALLSGVLLNVALLAVLRFKGLTDLSVGEDFAKHLFLFFGMFSIVIAALFLFVQRNYKRLLAYSSIEHMGLIVLGLGIGGAAVFASLLHMLFHALTKTFLFLASGNVLVRYGSTKFANVGGVMRTLPVTGPLFFVGFLALSGLPPFGIFATKFLIVAETMKTWPWLSFALLFFLAFAFYGFFRHLISFLFGPVSDGIASGESNRLTILPLFLILLSLLIMSLLLPQPVRSVLEGAEHLLLSFPQTTL